LCKNNYILKYTIFKPILEIFKEIIYTASAAAVSKTPGNSSPELLAAECVTGGGSIF
jgi:hypothetical protein